MIEMIPSELALAFLLAFIIDFVFGDPPNRFHPICFFAKFADFAEKLFRKTGNGFIPGAFAAAVSIAPFAVSAYILVSIAEARLGGNAAILSASVFLYFSFAPAGLAKHAQAVLDRLRNSDLPGASKSLSMMVGRNTQRLDQEGLVKACVESVAENFTDGVASPLFYASLGFALFGAPGFAAFAVLYRGANTLDSMWGKKNERYLRFGTLAARFDDILNFIPARLALPIVSLSALLRGLDWKNAFRIGMRDSDKHESPNSAWTEAAFSGALGLRLGGTAFYGDRKVEHPEIGEALEPANPDKIRKAIELMLISSFIFAATLIAFAAASSASVEILRSIWSAGHTVAFPKRIVFHFNKFKL